MYYHNPIVLTLGEIPQVTVVEVTVASELKLPNKVGVKGTITIKNGTFD